MVRIEGVTHVFLSMDLYGFVGLNVRKYRHSCLVISNIYPMSELCVGTVISNIF